MDRSITNHEEEVEKMEDGLGLGFEVLPGLRNGHGQTDRRTDPDR